MMGSLFNLSHVTFIILINYNQNGEYRSYQTNYRGSR